jgi:hypothetical protein
MPIYDFYNLLIEAPENEYTAHFFDDDKKMFQTVAIFVALGITQRQGVVLIASESRLRQLQEFQAIHGSDQVITFDSAKMLSRFFHNGKLDEQGFKTEIANAVLKLRKKYQKVRIWGGLVNTLLEDGRKDIAFKCVEMWNKIILELPFFLLHTYVLNPDSEASIEKLCAHHTFAPNGQALKPIKIK